MSSRSRGFLIVLGRIANCEDTHLVALHAWPTLETKSKVHSFFGIMQTLIRTLIATDYDGNEARDFRNELLAITP